MPQNNSLSTSQSSAPLPRTKRPLSDWRQLITESKISTLSNKAFCQQQHVSLSCFYKWRKYFKSAGATDGFVDITQNILPTEQTQISQDENNSNWQVELELGRGIILRVRCQ